MRAARRIQAALGQAQPLHRAPVQQMLADDLLDVVWLHKAIPDRPRIHHHRRPVLALVKASGLVHANLVPQPGALHRVLHASVDLALAVGGAGRPRRLRSPEICADKDMAIESRQENSPGMAMGVLPSFYVTRSRLIRTCFPPSLLAYTPLLRQ